MTRRTARVRVFGLAVVMAVGVSVAAWAQDTTERVSVSSGGVQGNKFSVSPAVSADGRFIVFSSYASNLVSGDINHAQDVFVRDRQMGTTWRVSWGRGWSGDAAISADGRFVAFYSYASTLVPGDTNGVGDMFVCDRKTSTTERVSVSSRGVQGDDESVAPIPAISANGRFVAFDSLATNLVPGDTNGVSDMFVRDRQTGTTRRVSVGSGSVQSNGLSIHPAISADGRFVAFSSFASNLVPGDTNGQQDVFLRDRKTGTTRRVSLGPGGVQANDGSGGAAISADGRFVAFGSGANNLVPGDTNGQSDVFVRDRKTGTTQRVSLGPGGVQANDGSGGAAISADGRFVAFESWASNLVPGDTNGQTDVFMRDRKTGTTRRVSVGSSGVRRRFRTTTDSRHTFPIAPNVLARNFTASAPNQAWVTDTLWTKQGWLYLAVILDLFSRRVVGWATSENVDRHLALAALEGTHPAASDRRPRAPLGSRQHLRGWRLPEGAPDQRL